MTKNQDNGGIIYYTYYPDGKSRTITAPGGNVTNMYYDLAGNQKKLVDPSAGTIKYTNNGFGELTSQVSPGDPGPKTTTISYLSDGRISQKVTTEGTTKYRYNTNKQLRNSHAPGNTSKTFRYDSKGRVLSVTDTIPGTDTLRTAFSYDNIGRHSTTIHPSGITESYIYSNGYLSSVSTGGTARWTINSMNARQQITTGQFANNLNATFGYDNYGFSTSTVTGTIQDNSYNFNPVTGNLNWRQNNKYTGLREDFQYDNLDRLISVQKNDTTTLSYDSNTGSILSKSDAGTFNYELKPYAISSIDPSIGFSPADTADAQSIDYTSTGSISSITEKTYEADFLYNSDNERVQMLVKQNGTSVLTRWYSGGGYVKEIDGSTTREYTFIGGDAYSSPVVAITQGGTTTYYDLLRDHLGSITYVVNSSTNAVVSEYSYDAWGRMRNPATWVNYASGSEPALFVAGRGYTGHEHLPWFNLINMNGRLYDPTIAMFLNPDNYIQDPTSSQNYNRYGYCLNNPLKYSDPSGKMMKASDESDAAFDAYFYWLCDGSMSFGNMAGGGGGSGFGGGHYGTMGSGFYDTGHYNYTTSDVMGSLWYATPADGDYTFTNVNGNWYHTATTTISRYEVTLTAGGISGSVLDVTFNVSGLKASGLQIIQTFYGSRNIYGTVYGTNHWTSEGVNYDAFVDGGKNSPSATIYGPADPTNPYYLSADEVCDQVTWNGTSGTIEVYDFTPGMFEHVVSRWESIIVATNYNGTGKDLILGAFQWGWNGLGSVPNQNGIILNSCPSDGALSIIKHDYPEYGFY